MKKILIYAILFWGLVLTMSSCTDTFLQQHTSVEIKEGIEVDVNINFGVSSLVEIASRSSLTDEREQTLSGLYLFIFNSDGTLDNKMFYNDGDFPNTTGKGSVKINLHSGYDKRFYAVGNPNTGAGDLSKDVLDVIETEDDLLKTTSRLNIPYNVERNMLLMSGKMQTSVDALTIDVDEKGHIWGAEKDTDGTPIIKLNRTDAKITFQITGKNEGYTNFEFVVKNYWVENIPQGTNVFENESEDYKSIDDGKPTYASMSTYSFKKVYDNYDTDKNCYSFTFYLPENRLSPASQINKDVPLLEGQTRYSLREKREKTSVPENPLLPGKTEENGNFVYANQNSTYVVFEGTVSYIDETVIPSRFVYANATYTIHLGAAGYKEALSDDKKIEAINDYHTHRNSNYTYVITVTDVNSMIVEVKEQKEKNPSVEGDVIVAGNEVKSMDAHYGRTSFKLTKKALQDGLSWAISTPFQKGLKVFDKDLFAKDNSGKYKAENAYTLDDLNKLKIDQKENLHDYKWVQFMINQELDLKNPTEVFAKYPGYQAYDGGSGLIGNGGTPAPPFGGEGFKSPSYNNETVKLYDIDQLINHLFLEAQKNRDTDADYIFVKEAKEEDDYVVVTAFVDEYIYKYDPTEYYYQTPDAVEPNEVQNLQLWKKVVNGDNRMLHFCEQGNFYSPDGNTTLAETVVTISQVPIYTFYNNMDNDLKTAWGVESINETGRLSVLPGRNLSTDHSNTKYNGRENTLNVLGNNTLRWDEIMYLTIDDYGDLKSGYQNIWYACIGRNRDLDGDDIVDADEIRWYLASIDQLTDMWIGQYSLPESAWLYPQSYFDKNPQKPYWHVASSSYYNNQNNPWVLWAEEGASRGEYSYSKSYNYQVENNQTYYNYDYRCVRNLGLSLNSINEYPEYYTDIKKNIHNNKYEEYIIEMSKLEGKSVRTAQVVGSQDKHNERSDVNRPFQAMAVLVKEVSSSKKVMVYPRNSEDKTDFNGYQDYNPCPDGYRIPNQREMMLMYTTLTTDRVPDLPNAVGGGYAVGNAFWSNSGDNGDNLVTFTSFGYNGKGVYSGSNLRSGFIFDQKKDLILDGATGKSSYVRCVRDVIPD